MEKKMFITLFLERTVKALCPTVISLEVRTSVSNESYLMINLKDNTPILIPLKDETNLEIAIATLESLKRIGG